MAYCGVVKDVFNGEEYEIPESWYHPELYMRNSYDCESEGDFVDLRDSGDLVCDLTKGFEPDGPDDHILGLPTPDEYFASIRVLKEVKFQPFDEVSGDSEAKIFQNFIPLVQCGGSARDHVSIMRANGFIASSKELKCKICSHFLKEMNEIETMICSQCVDIRQPVRVLFQSTYVIPARRNDTKVETKSSEVIDDFKRSVERGDNGIEVSKTLGVVLDRNLIDSEEVVDLAQYKMFAKELGIPTGHRGFLGVRDENYIERGALVPSGDPFMPYCTDDEMKLIAKRTSVERYDDSIIKVGHVLKHVKGEDFKTKIDCVSPRTIFGFENAKRNPKRIKINGNCVFSVLSYFGVSDQKFAKELARKNLGNTYFSVFSELLSAQTDGLVRRIRYNSFEGDRRDQYMTVASKFACEGSRFFLFSLSDFLLELPNCSVLNQGCLDKLEGEYDAIYLFEILHLGTLRKMLKMLRKHLTKDGFILLRICVFRKFSVFNSFNVISANGLEEFLKFKFCSVKHYVKMFTDLDLYATEVDDNRKNGVMVFYLQN